MTIGKLYSEFESNPAFIVSSVQSNEFWYLVCEDEKRDVCCVVVEGNIHSAEKYLTFSIRSFNKRIDVYLGRKMNSTIVDKTTLLRFIGIEPWKWIPAE